MILRAGRKAVKRRWKRKTPLPIKTATCLVRLFINRANDLAGERRACTFVHKQYLCGIFGAI
jgi:hypothetical protein